MNSINIIVSTLLISLLLYNSVGYIIIHVSHIAIIKSEMSEFVERTSSDSDGYKTLIFSTEEIYGTNPMIDRIDDREFRYKGNMYDIIKEEVDDNRIVIHCILDKKESLLELLFSAKFSKDKNDNLPQNISSVYAIKFLADYILCVNISYPDNFLGVNHFFASEKIKSFLITEIPTPPPQIS